MEGQPSWQFPVRDGAGPTIAGWLIVLTAAFHFGCSTLVFAAGPCDDYRIFDRLNNRCCALSIEPVYSGEVFNNARGGITTKDATQYQALLDLGLQLDFNQTDLPVPGKFFLLAQNTHGRGLTEDFIGDAQVISNIDSFKNIMVVGEYWWEFGLLDGDVTVRLGKQDFNTEFLFIEVAEDFIQSSFGLSPSAALPSYPEQSWAALALVQLNPSLQLKVGVWDALALGRGWGFSENDSVLVASELEYKYALRGKYPGIVSVGAGILTGDDEIPLGDVNGYSFQFEQLIYRECQCEEENIQGLSLFAGYYPRSSDAPILVDAIGDSFVAGLVYTGLVPGREEDVIGTGVAWAELFQGGTNEETVVELFYKAQITARMSWQPDLQYVATPSGIYSDALAVGFRFQVDL